MHTCLNNNNKIVRIPSEIKTCHRENKPCTLVVNKVPPPADYFTIETVRYCRLKRMFPP